MNLKKVLPEIALLLVAAGVVFILRLPNIAGSDVFFNIIFFCGFFGVFAMYGGLLTQTGKSFISQELQEQYQHNRHADHDVCCIDGRLDLLDGEPNSRRRSCHSIVCLCSAPRTGYLWRLTINSPWAKLCLAFFSPNFDKK